MSSAAPVKRAQNADDYAILIGVSRYEHLSNLAGPVRDVEVFAAWLTDAPGGGLPHKNITILVSAEGSVTGEDTPGPTYEHVNNAYNQLLKQVGDESFRGRRLYLYVSGHGYLSVERRVSLLLADATPGRQNVAIDVIDFAEGFRESGAFDEVVLFADCDQTVRSYAEPVRLSSPFMPRLVHRPEVSTFYGLATQPGQTALENIPTTFGGKHQVHGLFTQALLEGLHGQAAMPDGSVTSESLMRYLSERVSSLSEGQQQPYVTYIGDSHLVFVPPAEQEQKTDAEPEERPEPRPLGRERVTTQADDPATVDELGRRPFAEVIAARIEEVWKSQSMKGDACAFMVHIHGPWGSGKTSVLNFLRAHLQDTGRPREQRWVVVTYNAWRNQRIRPPWWTLIREIYTQSSDQLGFAHSLLLRVQWLVWRVRADLIPALSAVVLLLLAVLIATGVISFSTDNGNASLQLGVNILSAALAAVVGVFAFSRSLVFGSARAAQTYSELKSDPLGPIVNLFKKLVNAIRRPVLVLVDDMDRCDSGHVVELLEGIQTLFRTAPVTYVVAADRKWICSSFEKGFADFGKTIGQPGRPLGYLFLDKVFQVSASIPRLSPETRSEYWSGLLRSAGSGDPRKMEADRKKEEVKARTEVRQMVSQQELEQKIAEAHDNPVLEQEMRAAAAIQITSTEAKRATEHLLQSFAGMLEPNPRSMKRLVNAFGLNQATQFLEGRNVPPEVLARWTIIELRWPLLADFLAACPQFVAELANGRTPTDKSIPADLKRLFGDAEVKEVVAGDAPRVAALDEEAVRRIVGLTRPGTAAASGQAGQVSEVNKREE